MIASLARAAVAVAWLLSTTLIQAQVPAPESVTFASVDPGVTITALLFRPTGALRAPVVVGLHGCGGMWSSGAGRPDRLDARSTAWTTRFLAQGYAVLWPDSFNPRGRRSVCAVKRGEPSIDPGVRKLDVLGAIAFIRTQSGLDPTKVALVGWSHGGGTVLEAVNGKDAQVAQFYAAADAPKSPRAAVAFYPGCGASLRKGEAWLPAMPLGLFSGALDDWSATPLCVRLGDAARARGSNMTVTVYPDAHHGFDGPGDRLVHRTDVTRGVDASKGVTAGPNPAARAAVEIAVPAFLRENLKGSTP